MALLRWRPGSCVAVRRKPRRCVGTARAALSPLRAHAACRSRAGSDTTVYVAAYDGTIHAARARSPAQRSRSSHLLSLLFAQISALYGTPRYTSAYPTFVTAAMAVGGAQGASYRLSTDAIMFSSIALGPEGASCAMQSRC